MRIRKIAIRNFRGIRELDWSIPDGRIFCLVGRGDSTKSTILEAILRLFHPQWNLLFDDADFFNCSPDNTVLIEAVISQIPDDFRDLEKYGHWLSGWDATTRTHQPDPGEGLEDALRVRLTVGRDLEPAWVVLKDDEDSGVQFKAGDRAKVSVSLIGTTSDRHLTWSRGSILSKLTETENISASLAGAARAAKLALETRRAEDLTSFDAVAEAAEAAARTLGVRVSASYKAHLDTDAINVRLAGLALHDGDLPLRQLGLGSKRMLTTGLQKQALQSPHITLFDEVEVGLEPHRIARLLKHLKDDPSGQYFLTTHSPVVLRELTIADLYVVHSNVGHTNVVEANLPGLADILQGKIRAGAEAFLAPKVVVCEGATEVGLLRGLDDYWVDGKGLESFAYRGIALFDAEGDSKIKDAALGFVALGYDVAVLADSDSDIGFSDEDARELREAGATVVKWDDGFSIEERVFSDIPWAGAVASFDVARAIFANDQGRVDQVRAQYGEGFNPMFAEWVESDQLRRALGRAAKNSDWFKRQSWGAEWCRAIAAHLDEPEIQESDLVRKLASLRNWIDHV